MQKHKLVQTEQYQLSELECDVCGRDLMDDELERQEGIYINTTGGYSSVFGDGCTVSLDICQHCFKKLLGKYCTFPEYNNLD